MNYGDFFENFYFSRSEGMLLGYKSQKKIVEFFFTNGLDKNYRNKLPTSDSSYEKYFKGERTPNNLWSLLNNHFDEDSLQKELKHELNGSRIEELMRRFDIELGAAEKPDKLRFAKAIVAQFKALAEGEGSADNVVPSEYKKHPEPIGFETYLRGAKDKFQWMKLPKGGEKLLNSFFIVNNIGTSPVAFPHRPRGNFIKEATLTKIRTFDRRGEMLKVFLIGACGYGKTLMMQHLFIEAADRYNVTGLLPVLVKLRDFSQDCDEFVSFIVTSIKEFDLSFTYEMASALLEKGKMQILLDGLDEMDPKEIKHFQKKLAELCQRYPNNQIVISSRECSALNGIRRFTRLYIHPLDDDQRLALIDRLLIDMEDDKGKETILSFIDPKYGLMNKNGFIATNPMLLTIIVRRNNEIQNHNGDKMRFYELLYTALIREHDKDKESFERFFHSVGSSDEFTEVFREFCALSYMEGVYEFSRRSFEKYFKQLQSKDKLQNPSKFTITGFMYDACATACVMYEQEPDIYYIDPGFQDYFFSEYYYQQDGEATKRMGRELWNRKIDSFRNLDALKMLYETTKIKAEVSILLPYLETVFKGKSDEEAFLRYLSFGYGDVTYALIDGKKVKDYGQEKDNGGKFSFRPVGNAPQNIVLELILDILGIDNTFAISSIDEIVESTGATDFIMGCYEEIRDEENSRKILSRFIRGVQTNIAYVHDRRYLLGFGSESSPITDETGCAVVFGYIYKVDPLSLIDKLEEKKSFLEICMNQEVRKTYNSIKAFYLELAQKQKVNEFR